MPLPLNLKPVVWEWASGDWDNRAQYAPDAAEPYGTITWSEDLDSFKDERGYGAHDEAAQTLADFLSHGPHQSPPVEIVEAIIAHLQAPKPLWFDSYRLQKAALFGKLTTVQEMLAQGVAPDTPVRGLTPFFNAIQTRELEIAQALFAAGIDVNRRFAGMGETVLMTLAAYAPDARWEPLAQRIIDQGADLEARSRWGETPLMAATSSWHPLPGLVGLLLAAGAEVNARSQHGYTTLWKAVSRQSASLEVVQQLLKAGADVNASDNQGWSVLMEAIASSLTKVVPYLLAAGADVHALSTPTRQYESSKSVLQFALDYANPEIIKMIQGAGAT